jgi:hypothetical protein
MSMMGLVNNWNIPAGLANKQDMRASWVHSGHAHFTESQRENVIYRTDNAKMVTGQVAAGRRRSMF